MEINVRELLINHKNQTGYITYNTFVSILKNFNIENIEYEIKNEYSIEDINEKLGEYIKVNINVPLGLDYNVYKNDYVVNPLENTFNYSFLNVDEKIRLLFECGDIKENSIYCIHIGDYFDYVDSNEMISLEDTMNIYFKSLHSKNVFSISEIEKYEMNMFDKYEMYNKLIDSHFSFYDDHSDKINENIYSKTKITKIEFTYKPKSEIIFPLEIFFKKIQCNKSMPFSKFNPGKSLENIYRLYCPSKDKYGNKIPYFSMKEIKKYKDKIKKEKSVSLIILDNKKRTTIFHVNSEGEIYCNFENIEYNIDDYNGLTKYSANILNRILSLFVKYFDPTSLVYQEFKNIKEENIEINEIQYSTNLKQRMLKLDTKYFSGIFTKIDGENILNYKRVSNYNKMNDIDSTINQNA